MNAITTAARKNIFCRPVRSRSCRLSGKRSSIVWTERTAEAARIVALDDAAFHDELETRFGLKLGEISVAGPRQAFHWDLRLRARSSPIVSRLIGDAAHMIHPIAGQGLNMGIRDAAALAETIAEAARLGLDPGGADVLSSISVGGASTP